MNSNELLGCWFSAIFTPLIVVAGIIAALRQGNISGGGRFSRRRSRVGPVGPMPNSPPPRTPYTLRKSLLTPTEVRFYQALRDASHQTGLALNIGLTIAVKVRIADVLTSPYHDTTSFRRISQKHIDFIICDVVSLRPLVAVELDDWSHQRADRQARDQFVDRALAAARLPILHVSVESNYNVTALASQIKQAMTQGRD